jgi:hypothetical protein
VSSKGTASTTLPLFPPTPPPPPVPSARPGCLIALAGVSSLLYEPSDVDEQWKEWGANCGPSAIAALVGREVKDVRAAVEHAAGGEKSKKKGRSGRWLGYMHAGHLISVLQAFGLDPKRTNFAPKQGRWPRKGLAMIQTEGPWCHPPAKPTARFRYTHTVAVIDAGPPLGVLVYDGNAEGWAKEEWWAEHVMKKLVKLEKGATGWHITTTLEINQ